MSFKLGPKAGRRFSHGLVGGFVALLGLGVLLMGVTALIELNQSAGIVAALILSGLVFACGAILLLYGVRLLREYAFRGAKLTIDGLSLTIEDRHGLLEPIVVPLDQVVRCAVDKGEARNPGFMFPITRSLGWANAYREGSTAADRGWLVQPGDVRAGVLPMGARDVNLLLVFDRPQFFQVYSRVEGERKRLFTFAWHQAIVLPARAADQIVATLAARGIQGPLEEADVDQLRPVTHAEVGGEQKITDMLREMGWARQQVQRDTLQVSPASTNHAFFSGADTSALGLTREQLHSRIMRAVSQFYISIGVLVLGIAGFGVWLLFHATRPTPGIIMLIWAGLLARAGLHRPDPLDVDQPVTIPLVAHPRLLQEAQGVAQALGVEPPVQIDVNFELHAGVERSPFAGGGEYRVTLGLPLLALLTEREAGALLAHEFTHTRNESAHGEATQRGVHRAWMMSVAFSATQIGLVTRIVTRSFMRTFSKLSREVEYLADRTAAEVAGPEVLTAALRKTALAEHHMPMYWDQWVVPALDQGMHPPLIVGFRDYLRQATNGLDLALEGDRWARECVGSDDLNLQPQLDHRIAAIEKSFPAQSGGTVEFVASNLLTDDGYDAERALLGLLAGWDRSNALRRVEWSEVFAPQAVAAGQL